MGAMVAVAGSDVGRTAALRRSLAERGHLTIALEWPPEDFVNPLMSSGDGNVVLDGLLPGITLQAISEVVEARPEVGIVAVGPIQSNIEVLIGLASGISSYMSTGSQPEEVAEAVDALHAGKVTLPRALSLPLVAHLHNDELGIAALGANGNTTTLTHREWQVLVLARQTYTTAEIAARLVVSTATVRTHVAALVRKLDVPGRVALGRPLIVNGAQQTRHPDVIQVDSDLHN